jgi:hypothetical protein
MPNAGADSQEAIGASMQQRKDDFQRLAGHEWADAREALKKHIEQTRPKDASKNQADI